MCDTASALPQSQNGAKVWFYIMIIKWVLCKAKTPSRIQNKKTKFKIGQYVKHHLLFAVNSFCKLITMFSNPLLWLVDDGRRLQMLHLHVCCAKLANSKGNNVFICMYNRQHVINTEQTWFTTFVAQCNIDNEMSTGKSSIL